MLAAVYKGPGNLVLEDRPEPRITRDDQVLLKVEGVGICGTDLHILQVPPAHPARPGIIEGHEFTGRIAALGDSVTGLKIGDAVLVDPHPGCGTCAECRRGFPDHCTNLLEESGEPGHPGTIGIFSDGAMTSYVVVPSRSVFRIGSGVPYHIRALAEPLACVVNASGKIGVRPGDYSVVLGAGPIGLLFTVVLRASGASKIVVSEPSAYRRAAALKCGADVAAAPKELEAVVRDLMREGPDVVVEAVGPLLPLAVDLVRTGGRILQFGHDETVNPAIHTGTLLKKEAAIYGAFIGKFSFERTARIMESGRLPLEEIVSHRMPLRDVHKGIELLKAGRGLKIVLYPEED